MGWITLAERKLSLIEPINQAELRLAEISRERRALHRELSFEQLVLGNDKQAEIDAARAGYDAIKEKRPSVSSEGYEEWKADYADAQETFEAAKLDIEAYYDDIMQRLEDEATQREQDLEQEQVVIETQLEVMRGEKDAVGEQISSDIESTTPKFG